MKRMIWVSKSDSFNAANEFDDDYYLSMSREERLETLQFLREIYFKVKKALRMKVEKDYEELLKLLNKHKVKYCIIGAYAVAFYAKPRYTKDMYILVEPSSENSEKIVSALNDFGFKSLKLSEEDFCRKGRIVQLGYKPVRIDIITSIEGSRFKDVWNNKVISTYGDEKVFFIGIDELIKNKQCSKRPQDKIDLDLLMKAKKKMVIKN